MTDNEDCGALVGVTTTPRDSIGSVGVSFSSGPLVPNSCSNSSISKKMALNECSAAWITYLNVLNNLCGAGSKLAHSIALLEQSGLQCEKPPKVLSEKTAFHSHPSSYLTNSWNDLARATAVATSTVKSHIMAVLQDFVLSGVEQSSNGCEMEQKRVRDHTELIVLENAQTMINLQHQFCAASYEAFSSLTCCFVCQSPVGFPHEQDCSIIKQKSHTDQRSQTPSPHFSGAYKTESSRGNYLNDQKQHIFGSTTAQISEQVNYGVEPRGTSPQQNVRDPIPLESIFENTRGPLPNPGELLSMKIPFYRSVKSPLNFPLFPLNGQRRWSEAAAGEVIDNNVTDAESQMRRWSMPWEESKFDQNTVTWYQTRIMPFNTHKLLNQKIIGSERSNSNTPDSNWQSSLTSHDGLTEAIQLLSCRPAKNQATNLQQIFSVEISETASMDQAAHFRD